MEDQIKRRSLLGKVVALRNGGRMRLLPRVDNLAYQEKMRRLDAALRFERGIDPGANLWEVLDEREWLTLMHRAQIGTVIMNWFDFDDEDNVELPSKRADGSLDEEIGIAILLSPGVGNDFLEAIEPIDEAHKRHREVMEKNSSEPSVGNSATEGSSAPTDPN